MAQLLKEVFTWVLSNCDFKQTYFLLPKEAIAVYNVVLLVFMLPVFIYSFFGNRRFAVKIPPVR
ncbi:MAG: hypothetical protein V7L21_26400 [Nostoc sp.]|uniref:hypothetical protein n=1 Tax=Nostoc sp. TaxID=1180 RepID=UPI002FFCFE2F